MELRLFTLEQLRYIDICRVDFEGRSSAMSDKTGFAALNETKIARGPTGVYSMAFTTVDNYNSFLNSNNSVELEEKFDFSQSRRILQTGNVTSKELNYDLIQLKNKIYRSKKIMSKSDTMLVKTDIDSIEIVNLDKLPRSVEIGKPISPGPIIKITDRLGKPIQGKVVTIFSYDSYTFSIRLNYGIKANKFALLKDNISPPTDVNGLTSLKNLTVLGSNYKSIYLMIYCDGITISWYVDIPNFFSEVVNFHVFPTFLNTNVANINVIANQTDIIEGNFFDSPPLVIITDINNNPIEGKVVFAEIVKIGTKKSKYGLFLNSKFNWIKKLKFPVNGDYYMNTKDFYPDNKTFENPVFTNSKGEVRFNKLLIDTLGAARDFNDSSNFTILLNFVCDGIGLDNFIEFNLISRVSYVLNFYNMDKIILTGNQPHFLNVLFSAFDNYNKAVLGNTPDSYYLKDVNSNKMTATVVPYYSGIVDTNGNVDLFVKNIGNITLGNKYRICLTIDQIEGCNIEPIEITFDSSYADKTCSYINLKLDGRNSNLLVKFF